MASCKDCIHDKVCSEYFHAFWGHTANKHSDLINADPKDCPYFKDRSRFVELPCKIGDAIFCTTMGKIYQGIVGRIELDNEGFAIITTDGYCFDSSICYHTQEEAEQALKEREENAGRNDT